MPTTYYTDGSTLLNSTSIFIDAGLTTCADDGFYSDGTNSREQVNCVLLPSQVCGTCAVACGDPISAGGVQGIYLVSLDLGSDTGAVIITFNPQSIPDGIRVTYNSGTYNKLSSPVDGYHASTNANNYTFIGNTDNDCGIAGTTYPALTESNYNGSSFVATGNTQSVTVAPGDVSLSLGVAPGNCVMVVPKISATPTLLQVAVVGPCGSTAWTIDVQCAELLTGYSSTTQQPACTEACGFPLTQTYYNAPVTGTPGSPAVYDWVFSDANGQFILTDGFYGFIGGSGFECMTVQNGIIVAISTCSIPPPPTEYIYLSTVRSLCYDFCEGTNYTIVTQKTTVQNHSYANITLGDNIFGSVIVDGFYAYAGSQTDTATGIYKIMQVENNEVISILLCGAGQCFPE